MLAAGALALTLMCSPASSAVRIANDAGGKIGPYLDRLVSLRASGENVIIDGPCLSACTMLLGVIPRDRICVTGRARLGFHAAWLPDASGRRVVSQAGTQALWDVYPHQVREWLRRRGGLKPNMVFLQGRELASMYSPCR